MLLFIDDINMPMLLGCVGHHIVSGRVRVVFVTQSGWRSTGRSRQLNSSGRSKLHRSRRVLDYQSPFGAEPCCQRLPARSVRFCWCPDRLPLWGSELREKVDLRLQVIDYKGFYDRKKLFWKAPRAPKTKDEKTCNGMTGVRLCRQKTQLGMVLTHASGTAHGSVLK